MFFLGVWKLREFSMRPRASKQLGSSAASLGASGGNKVPQMARDGFPDKQGTIAVTRANQHKTARTWGRGSTLSTVLVPPSCSRPIIIPHPSFPLSADILWNAKQLSQSQHPSLPSRHQANFFLAQLSSHKPPLPHSQASADRQINSLRRHKLGESKYKLRVPSIISISSLAQLKHLLSSSVDLFILAAIRRQR